MPPVTATQTDVLYYEQTLIFQLSRKLRITKTPGDCPTILDNKLRIRFFMSMVMGQYNLTQQASK